MVSPVEKALARSRSVYTTAHNRAIDLKQKGTLSSILDFPSGNIFDSFSNRTNFRNRYRLFRGWVHAAVNALAQEGAGQPVNLGRLKGTEPRLDNRERLAGSKDWQYRKMTATARNKAAKEELEIVFDHDLLNLLENPNPIQHRWQFVYTFFANLGLTGWGYIVGETDDNGNQSLYSLPTTWIKPIHTKGAFAEFKIEDPNSPGSSDDQPLLTRDNVAFAQLPDPANLFGALAPAQAQSRAIGIDDKIQSSQRAFFENGVFPSMIVTMGTNPHPDGSSLGGMRPRLTAQQRRQVYTAIRKVQSGVANYGNPAIIDGLIERYDRMSATSNEMGWERSEGAIRTRILSAFGVHPFILGEPVNLGGYAQAAKIEDRFCKRVNTYLDLLGTVMTEFAASRAETDSRLLVWWDACKADDPALDHKIYAGARQRDDISQNELRAWMGLPPDEDNNQSVINRAALNAVANIAIKVTSGELTSAQGESILIGLGLPSPLAKRIAGPGVSVLTNNDDESESGSSGSIQIEEESGSSHNEEGGSSHDD